MKIQLNYFSEYKDKNGTKHYTVNKFNTIDRTIVMVSDYKFTEPTKIKNKKTNHE